MHADDCQLKLQGYTPGSCGVRSGAETLPACRATLKAENGRLYRRIRSIHLSRPENYLSVYQSGCNFSCRKCHSWYFSKFADGDWMDARDILKLAQSYDRQVTLREERAAATAWHAHDTCRCCGACVVHGWRSDACPGVLDPEAIVLSPQGWGPVRNIVGFTGGDLTCRPDFYAQCAQRIKDHTDLWVLIETNGFGLTSKNLEVLRAAGVDAFWLDIKAFDAQTHARLTGCDNARILKLPAEIVARGFVLEVLSLYIPGLVEAGELARIAGILAAIDPGIPFTILAFFPEYRMKRYRPPTVQEMVAAYKGVKETGLANVRLGNVGVFAAADSQRDYLARHVDHGAW